MTRPVGVVTCAVCNEQITASVTNADGARVCEPSALYFRVGGGAAYRTAMIEHKLLVPRETPRQPDEPVLPCGWGARPTDAA